MDYLPQDILSLTGAVKRIRFPLQGDTSVVGIVEGTAGRFAVKMARGRQFRSWLRQEVRVLNALRATSLPIPQVHLFLECETRNQGWAVLDYLDGEPLGQALRHLRSPQERYAVLCNVGRTLAEIHATSCPEAITGDGPWLDRMLAQAAYNLDHYNVDGSASLLQKLRVTQPEPVAPTLIHGDFTVDNVLVQAGKVTGVVDWSGGALGDPRYDLSLAIRPKANAFQQPSDADAFFEGYGRSPLTDDDVTYFATGLYEFF